VKAENPDLRVTAAPVGGLPLYPPFSHARPHA
jgi:hypothetical protein